jgi:uncharacterized repeat protein (TIGR02543 family)
LKKIFIFLLAFIVSLAQWNIGMVQVHAVDYKFNNGLIRFDQSSPTAINTNTGFLNQPFYHSADGNWYKLTFSSYPLDFALAEGGDGSSSYNINGSYVDTNIGLAFSNLVIDSSGLIINGDLSYGILKTSGTITINDKSILVENTFDLKEGKSFVKITTKIINQSSTESLTNLRYWVGTRDDYVGNSDRPTKVKGNIIDGVFTPISSTSDLASAVQITTASEGVLFYTTEVGANMSVKGCCSFVNATQIDPVSSAITTTTTDGSYAMFLRLNDLASSESQTVIWYYAAGALADLASVVSDVGSAAAGSLNVSYTGLNTSFKSTTVAQGYYVVVARNATAPSAAQIKAGHDATNNSALISGTIEMLADVEAEFEISGLTEGSDYDLYFVTEYIDTANGDTPTFTAPVKTSFSTTAYSAPILDTEDATPLSASISNTNATINGEVSGDGMDGTAGSVAYGVCYSKSAFTSTGEGVNCFKVGTGTGSFSTTLTGLERNTTYYVRTYATNSEGTSYSSQSTFTTANVMEQQVNYHTNGGTSISSAMIEIETLIIEPNKPDRNGYSFGGWYTDSALQNAFNFLTTPMPTSELNLYAKWNTTSYSISYDYDGGSGTNPTSYTINESITFNAPTKDGYQFLGWTPITGISAGSTGNISVLANWKFVPRNPILGDLSLMFISVEEAQFSLAIIDYGNPRLNSFTYFLTNQATGITTSNKLGVDMKIDLSGLQTYDEYTLKVVASNGNTTVESNTLIFKPKLSDQDEDGVPDVRDAYPEDPSRSMDVTKIQPDISPKRTFVGNLMDIQSKQYEISISQKDLMGLSASDNILVIMGSVQFIIPVAMLDVIISNTTGESAYLRLKVEPRVIEINPSTGQSILDEVDMDVLAAFNYLLFRVYSDGSEEAISELGGTIKVGIGLNELEGEYDPSKMEVYFYNSDDGSIKTMQAIYDPVNQSLVFLTEHFSYYVLGIKKKDDPINTGLKIVFLAIAVCLTIIYSIIWFFKKKKSKKVLNQIPQ